eukprot:TRINITY_DN671_c0_g1_i2.p1 TRINITY_DN671_c0_g1~~TRINITY_DN671_c0_g1_i2.p1  ORF type:complete len:177 (+),score=40.07 TRINITY_DN671_c0_g1_i2:503-1033(+)
MSSTTSSLSSSLAYNSLNGTIPSFLSNLKFLQNLEFNDNYLCDDVPVIQLWSTVSSCHLEMNCLHCSAAYAPCACGAVRALDACVPWCGAPSWSWPTALSSSPSPPLPSSPSPSSPPLPSPSPSPSPSALPSPPAPSSRGVSPGDASSVQSCARTDAPAALFSCLFCLAVLLVSLY